MTFSRKTSIIGSVINCMAVRKIRYLGVFHDDTLHLYIFSKYIDDVVSKVSKAIGFIVRTSAKLNNIKRIKVIYCSFVRSYLNYTSQVWNTCYETYTSRLEAIQQRFLRFLDQKSRQFSSGYEYECTSHFLPRH